MTRLLMLMLAVLATTATPDAWMTRPQLAERLQVSVKTLAMWATYGRGPRYARPGGGGVRYRLSDVEAWEATQFGDGAA